MPRDVSYMSRLRGARLRPGGGFWYTCPMERSRFERLVRQAVLDLPEAVRTQVDNLDLVVEDWPTEGQLLGSGLGEGDLLLGLYEGVPLTNRHDYGMVLPDKITLFQRSIESLCSTEEEIVREVRETVFHEVAHHFGIDDERLAEMGR